MTPVEATATWSACTPPAMAAAPCILAASSIPRPPVAAFALPELATTTRSASSRERSRVTSTGAASTPERVKRAALVVVGRVGDEQADVGPAAGLDARRHARGAEAGRQAAGGVLAHPFGHLDPARGEEGAHSSPTVSSHVEHQVEVLDRLRRGALPQVVDGGEDEDLLRALVHARVDAAEVRVAHVAHAGRPVGQLDERLVRVGVGEQRVDVDRACAACSSRRRARPGRAAPGAARRSRGSARRGRPAPGRSRSRGGGRPRRRGSRSRRRRRSAWSPSGCARRPTRRSWRR